MLVFSLLMVALSCAFLAWLFGFFMRRHALVHGLVDVPDAGRHRHDQPVPYGGGIVAWTVCVIGFLAVFFLLPDWFRTVHGKELVAFLVSAIPLLIVGTIDDRFSLSPKWLLFGAFLSVSIALLFGFRVHTLMEPIGGGKWALSGIMSYLISFVWLLACTGATKFSDGVDGLVAGQTVIGSLLIAGLCLTTAFFQPEVALLAAVFGGSFLGVLLHGWPRARLFLGEFGSTFAGFGLGVLAIISGAKFAIALMAMGFFVADIILVMLRRVWRGHSPFEGDRTHLHFVLLEAGMPAWGVSILLWTLGLGFGLAALQLQTRGKLALVVGLVVLTWMLLFYAMHLVKRREKARV
ncbi:undecaprenyl/decaprenyl-phosphate alpha-N-acetylglucosaminyl 1-phosphate transferase [Patescibacteria group bacterium]|nr:undecaprenyl/decaprenyl-phosphate alpha-N-acetylglucosaminyl 1-phosphate transferase [Patescibacteria group bacterium]